MLPIDPILVALAGRVASLLKPLIQAGADELKKTVGVPVVDRLTGMLATLRKQWEGDAEGTQTIDSFQRDPAGHEQDLADLLARRMAADPQLADTVYGEARAIGPRVMIRMEGGHVRVQEGPEIGWIKSGDVRIDQNVQEADQQKGPKIDQIG